MNRSRSLPNRRAPYWTVVLALSLTVLVEFPPGAYTPKHVHAGSVFASMIGGRVRSQLAGEPALVFDAGEGWHEPPGAIHLFAENASTTQSASLLATFVSHHCTAMTRFL